MGKHARRWRHTLLVRMLGSLRLTAEPQAGRRACFRASEYVCISVARYAAKTGTQRAALPCSPATSAAACRQGGLMSVMRSHSTSACSLQPDIAPGEHPRSTPINFHVTSFTCAPPCAQPSIQAPQPVVALPE